MDKIENKNSNFWEVIAVENFIHKHTGLEFCFDGNRVSGLQCTDPKKYKAFIKKQKKS